MLPVVCNFKARIDDKNSLVKVLKMSQIIIPIDPVSTYTVSSLKTAFNYSKVNSNFSAVYVLYF